MEGKCKRKSTCKYSLVVSAGANSGTGHRICGYILFENRSRGCPAETCDKYVERKTRVKKGIKI